MQKIKNSGLLRDFSSLNKVFKEKTKLKDFKDEEDLVYSDDSAKKSQLGNDNSLDLDEEGP